MLLLGALLHIRRRPFLKAKTFRLRQQETLLDKLVYSPTDKIFCHVVAGMHGEPSSSCRSIELDSVYGDELHK